MDNNDFKKEFASQKMEKPGTTGVRVNGLLKVLN
jgi:hypothetical protein